MVHFCAKSFTYMRRSGEIGRHAALRGLWEKSCRGSSPLFGTSYATAMLAGQCLVKNIKDIDESFSA